jgi:hypothetical protein
MTTFGDLRSAVHRQPSRENFQHVIALLEGADASEEAVRDEWIPYLASSLSAWPDDARAPGKDQVKALEKRDTAWSGLVRTLDYEGATLSQKRVRAIAAAAHLSHIERLDLRASSIRWPLLGELVESAPFGKLRSFALRKSNSSGVDAEVFEALLASPMLSEVEELYFNDWARMTGKVLDLVLDTVPLGRLRVLDIKRTKASAASLRKMFAREELSALEELHLDELGVPVEALAAATHLENLRVLEMEDWETTIEGMSGIPEHLRNLESWGLRYAVRELDGLRKLLEPEVYPNLRRLDLRQNGFGDEGLGMLAEATCFPALEELTLTACGLTRYDALERMEGFTSLEKLTINGNRPEAGQLAAITRAPFYGRLTHLSAASHMGWQEPAVYDGLFDAPLPAGLTSLSAYVHGEEAIARCLGALDGGQELTYLDLSNMAQEDARGLSEDTVDALVGHPALANLERLTLRNHDPTDAQIERILGAFPRLERLTLGKLSDASLVEKYRPQPVGGCRVLVSKW